MTLAGRLLATGIALLVATVVLIVADLAVAGVMTRAMPETPHTGLVFATFFSQTVQTIAPPLGAALIAAALVIRHQSRE